jgi:exopolyphosphatase/guanosine-5'-triphosphate,3'-diphosphate pyrophosphatase
MGLAHDAVDTVATSAIRDAANQGEFIERAEAISGLEIRVLSWAEEARYAYVAAINSSTLRDGLVLDLGGGSLQLVGVRDRVDIEHGSWPLGAVRMTERFLPGTDAPTKKQLRALRSHVSKQLKAEPWVLEAAAGGRIVGLGGSVRNLASAAELRAQLPSFGVQGFSLGRDALGEIIAELADESAERRGAMPGIKPERGDLILAAAIVIESVLDHAGLDALEVTEFGLREGVFLARHLAPANPPLVRDVREASVRNLAAQYTSEPLHVTHVAALALQMWDALAEAGLHAGSKDERQLLWAASLLHDIGQTVDYDDHHKHSRYLILNGGLPGFTPVETAIIAQAVRYHRKGMPVPGPMAALFGDGDIARLDRCATLLRLAEDLERSRDQLVRSTSLALQGGEVELRLIADGESAVPRWAAGRERELFARAFHRDLCVAA